MRLDDDLKRRGFRRWYERQLIEAHAYLISGFLSLIMMAIALETIEFRESLANTLMLALVAACGGGAMLIGWRRFTRQLFVAETLAEQATCKSCNAYGRFEVIEAHDDAQALTGRLLTVRCRRCSHQWSMG